MATNAFTDFRIALHVLRGSADQDLRAWYAAGHAPQWIKVFAPVHCIEATTAAPGIKTLLRFQDMSEDDRKYLASRESGKQFVRDARARCGGSFTGAHVTALEFMNEKTDFENVARLQQCDTAALGFVEECAASGVAPVIHNASFANPRPDLMRYLMPSIREAINAGGYYGTHAYGPRDLYDGQDYYVLCWQQQLLELLRVGLVVPTSRLLITEFGHDDVTDPNYHGESGPWRKLGLTPQYVAAEYERYDDILRQAGVAAAFLYCAWDYAGSDYEVMPYLHDWYAAQLAAHVAPPPPPPPPPPTFPRRVRVVPGGDYESAYLRRSPQYGDTFTTVDRGQQIVVESETGAFYKVAAYIPKALTAPAQVTLAEFVQAWTGKVITYGGIAGECVGLVRTYLRDVLGVPQLPLVDGAVDWWTNYDPAYWERVVNGPTNVPPAGSLVLWDTGVGEHGHVAVALRGDARQFVSFDQNFPEHSPCHEQVHDYTHVLGWLIATP